MTIHFGFAAWLKQGIYTAISLTLLLLTACVQIPPPADKPKVSPVSTPSIEDCMARQLEGQGRASTANSALFIAAWEHCLQASALVIHQLALPQAELLTASGYDDTFGIQIQFLPNAAADSLHPGQAWQKELYWYFFTPRGEVSTQAPLLLLTWIVRDQNRQEQGRMAFSWSLQNLGPGLQRLRWNTQLPKQFPWPEGSVDLIWEVKVGDQQDHQMTQLRWGQQENSGAIIPALGQIPPLVRLRVADNDATLPSPIYRPTQNGLLVDIVRRVTVRASPNQQAKSVGVISKGDRVPVLTSLSVGAGSAKAGELWYQISFANGKTGWIPKGVTR